MLRFGSLFAGIGGIDLGLERAGMRCQWQVEIDDYARRVLAKHWPDVPRYRDVRECGAGNLSAVDLIAGGFPCQDISSAGKRAGITGARSGLWSEFARIIRELRPRYVLVENVPALLYPLRRGKRVVEPAPIGRVLGDLVACGYDAEWQCIPAAALGAPHIRDRVYIVAYAHGSRDGGAQHEVCSGRHAANGGGANGRTGDVADAERDRWEQGAEVLCARQPVAAASREDVADASIARGGRLATRQLNQDTPIDLDRRGQALADADSQRCDGRYSVFQATSQGGRSLTEGDNPWRTEPGMGRVAHGVPSRVDRLRGLGNAVVPQVAEWIGRRIIESESQWNHP